MIREYDRRAPDPEATEAATVALGCFWGPDAEFGALEGVVRTRVGYAGGSTPDPTYRDLGDHTESVQIDYDSDVVSFDDLLDVSFRNHDRNRQPGKRQYQNIVFYHSDEQRERIASYLDAEGLDADGIATRIERLDRFHLAEDYHQKYNLRAAPALLDPFEAAGYDDAEIRDSPAAAVLNGVAAGEDLPDDHDLNSLVNRAGAGPSSRP